jgi:hypothetical protein
VSHDLARHLENEIMASIVDDDESLRRRLCALKSRLDRHDHHYHCRHTPESTRLRIDLVRQIQELEQHVSASDAVRAAHSRS